MKRIPNTLYMDGYDDCLVGHIERFGQPLIACYDKARVLHKLEQDGMTADEDSLLFVDPDGGPFIGVGDSLHIFHRNLPKKKITKITSEPNERVIIHT